MAFFGGFRSRRDSANRGEKNLQPRMAPRRLGIMALEPRIMYDAAAAATAATADAAAQTHQDGAADTAGTAADKQAATPASNTGAAASTTDTSTTDTSKQDSSKQDTSLDASSTAAASTGSREVVFIDPQSADLLNLYGGVKDGDLVFVLDPNKDGLQQIADILAAQDLHDLDAIHIISHGTDAQVRLGTTVLSENNVNDHAAALAAIGAALKADGDILLYGCDVAAGTDGAQFIADIARLTGADIAASTDATGSADQGGNWTLEASTGAIAATMPFTDAALASYEGTLAIQFSDGSESTFASPSIGFRVVTGDFNNDGKMDLLYQTGSNGSSWNYLQGNGNGTFAAAVASTSASSPFKNLALVDYAFSYSYHVGDYDNDGDTDIWVSANGTTGTFYRNDNGVFSNPSSAGFPAPQFNARVVQGDFDGDGDLDFLYQTGADNTSFIYLRNDSSGGTLSFTSLAQSSSPFSGVTLGNMNAANVYHPGDFDGDGDTDLWYQSTSGGTGTYYRNDNGSYVNASSAAFPSFNGTSRVVVGDFDSDGDDDILFQDGPDGSVYKVMRGGTFDTVDQANSVFAGMTLPNFNLADVFRPADYDGDGDTDLYISAAGSTGHYYVQGGTVGGTDNNPPTLASSTPSDNSTGVAQNANITLTFDESVTKGTGNIYIVRTSDNVVVETIAVGSAQVTGSGSTWTIDPSITLAAGTAYAVRVDSKTFVDSDGAVFFGINDNTTLNFQTLTNTPPTITSDGGAASAARNVAENSTAVTTVTATDPDAGTTFTYSITGGADAAKFAINASTGALTFISAPDFENPTDVGGNNVYDVTVQVSDGTAVDTQAIAVTVTNVSEAPTITSNGGGAAAAVNVAENATAVTTVAATDPDAGTTLTYSISGGADAAKFAINASTGVLTFIAAPDFENPTDSGNNNVYDVTVQVSDGSLTDTQAIAVTVTNLNDNPPVISSNGSGPTAAVNVAENSTAVTTVTATDADAGTTFTYSISGGADAAKFAINAATGALTFISAPDFENPTDSGNNNVYDVTVQVSDGTNTDTQAIAVTVTNVNEAPAITSDGGGAAAVRNVAENSTAVTTVVAADPDAGTTLTYSISGGADAAKFAINASTGALTFIATPDFENPTDSGNNNVYDVTVQVSDGSLTDTQAIAVTVTNVNEAPVIGSNGAGPTASVNVAENATAVTTVTATDPDAGTTLTYSISGGADAAKFAINAATGALTFISAPNFENPTDLGGDNIYDVTVQVSDGTLTDTQAIAVAVTNVNEAPAITSDGAGPTASLNVAENATAVTTVAATDPDAGTTLTYSISGGADAAKFTINASTGALTFISAPDFENPTDSGNNNVYDVTVQVSDGSLTDTQAIAVTVTDLNDNPPVISSNGSGPTAAVNVAENSTAVTTVTATDADAGTTFSYSISGGADAAKFAINAATGALTFISAPDFENPGDAGADNVYDVTVQVSDGANTDSQAIAVTVTNVNEAPAVTSNGGGAAAALNVAENSTAVTTVMATDPDAGTTLTYSISGGADAAKFAINASTGALTFISAPDFENPTDSGNNNVYDVTVQVSDGSLTDSQAIAVTVTNVNEAPAITSDGGGAAAVRNVAENSTAVTTVTATDPDAGTTVTYSISGGADAAKFAINAATGALTFVSAPDFENPTDIGADNIYDVTVQVSDGALTASQSIAVTVTNVNEAPAITSDGGGAAAVRNVAENSTAVTTVTATDPDAGTTLTYSILGGADAAKFAINASTGALSFVSAPDFENPTDAGADNVYDVTVQVSDGSLTDSQAIAVTVTNVNEAPSITSNGAGASASLNVAENSTAVTTVTAADPDAGTTFTYSISGGADAAKFAINAATGALTFISAPDFENPTDAGANNVYDVTVQVSDGTLTDSQAIAVTVTNVNEAPAITSNGGGVAAALNVAENATAVTTVTATDPDAGTTLTYAISGGADAAKFTINASTGALSFISAPDFENPTDAGADNVYDVTVQVSDGSLTDSQAIAVTVTNVNDNVPVITSNGSGAAAALSVAENSTAVTTVTATDADVGTTLTYSISGGADAAKFAINAATGALSFISAPDFENPTDAGADNIYDVVVQASDGSLTDSQAIAVTVTNVNEAPAITSNGGGAAATLNVAENSTAVTTVTALDSDAGTTLTYSISGGADAAKFAINASTGALTFISAPDFENPTDVGADNVYDVTVQVSDGSLTDSQAIAVAVTNVNETPAITSDGGGAAATLNVAENATAVTTVTATDPDAGTTFTYSISGGADAAKFAINASTGALTFISAPDFENPTDAGADNVYDVVVQVSDGALTDSQAIAVTVTNVNEAPAITSDGGGAAAARNVAENSTAVTTVTALDSDAGTTLTYSISGGADAAKFAINASTGALSFISAPDFENPTDAGADNIYDVTVQVSDGSLTDSQAIVVTVTNVNEVPSITSDGGGAAAVRNVAENSTAVTTVTATDPDAGTTLTYSISGGADAARFVINASTGALSFVAAPDFETPTDVGADNVYDVVVQVSDGSLTDSQAIAVTVTNVNEAPSITSNGAGTTASLNVVENTAAVTTVAAVDPDAGTTLTYAISGGADAAKFHIDSSTGALTFISAPDFEHPTDSGGDNVYDVVVQVSDGALTDSQAIAVTVTNVNEAPSGAAHTIVTAEDTSYTFVASDFGFADASDNPANSLQAVIITTVPAAGTLTDNGVAVTAGQAVSAADIAAGLLVFTPDADGNGAGYASFAFRVQDNGGTANGGVDTDPTAKTLTIDVTPVNDAPVISGGTTLAFDANTRTPVPIDPAIAVHDVDSATLSSARVVITAGLEATDDSLNFVNQNGITGTYDSATGVLTLTGVASVADYQAALASVSFSSTTQQDGVRTIQMTVNDGSTQFSQSQPAISTLSVTGIITPPHLFIDNSQPPASPFVTPAALVFDSTRAPLAPPVGDDFGTRAGFSYHIVRTDPVLSTASDYNVQIKLALAALEAPLGGDVVYVGARLANGDPLPDWLKFDPATGTFAGLPPDGMFASIEGGPSSDDNIATGALPPNPNLGVSPAPTVPAASTITVQVQARDSSGNIAVTTFTIDLRPRAGGKQGWNMDWHRPVGGERLAGLPMISPELAAIEAAVRDVIRPIGPLAGRHGGRGESIAAASSDIALPGRAGLTEQLASVGWRSMDAQRNALLASLQQYR